MLKSNRRQFIRGLGLLSGASLLSLPIFSFNNIYEKSMRIIVDADTANEVDDLFAIVRAIIEPNFLLEGITTAQWHTQERAPNDTVGESQRINAEIIRLMGRKDLPIPEGANFPMVKQHRPQASDAADFIIEKAKATAPNEKLSLVILGPATNIASAVLLAPEIIPKIAVYYLGFWHQPATKTWSKREFNTNNDPNAIDLLINTPGLELHIMTASTSQHLVFKKEIVDQYLKGKGGIADYLVDRWESYDRFWQKTDKEKKQWVMWDVAIIEALANPAWAKQELVMSPHDNLARAIYAYTQIDAKKMEENYWHRLANYLR